MVQLLKKDFEVRQVEEKEINRLKGETTHAQKATLIAENGEKVVLTASSLPSQFQPGASITVAFSSSQTTLDDASEKEPEEKPPKNPKKKK